MILQGLNCIEFRVVCIECILIYIMGTIHSLTHLAFTATVTATATAEFDEMLL